jgi:hypothetical protein
MRYHTSRVKQDYVEHLQCETVLRLCCFRRCNARRNVAGSISDEATRIFHWFKPSDYTMTLGSTQPLRQMSTKNTPLASEGGGKSGRCVGLTTLPPSCADCLEILEPQRLGNLGTWARIWIASGSPSTRSTFLWSWYFSVARYTVVLIQVPKRIWSQEARQAAVLWLWGM